MRMLARFTASNTILTTFWVCDIGQTAKFFASVSTFIKGEIITLFPS
jgi:hypothetical protein